MNYSNEDKCCSTCVYKDEDLLSPVCCVCMRGKHMEYYEKEETLDD